MSTPFTKLIIKAPFLFVKGFLMGFMHGRNVSFDYFFHRKSGIRRETLGEIVKEFLVMDCYTDLCLPSNIVNHFETALNKIDSSIGVSISEKREILRAEFSFSFEIFNQDTAKVVKQLFDFPPPTVELINFNPIEKKEEQLVGIHEYTHLHPYVYQGDGIAKGGFEGIMNLYLTIKRSEQARNILCSEIQLYFN
jgi:hypothetical protein